jgi:hypothetical protein
MVACLAGPDGTVASHLTAAALFGLWELPAALPHVTVPRTASGRMKVATVHRSPLDPDDLGTVDGIPVTRPGRTIVDCAAVLAHDDLCKLVDDALCRSLCSADDLHRAMERASRGPGRAGLARLEEALKVWTPGAPPGSPAEIRLIRRLVGWGLPVPERQVKIFDAAGRFVAKIDVGWEERRAGLEYYGERHHGPRAESHDERRMGRIEATGWEIRIVRKGDLHGTRATALRAWLSARLLR